jgi:O-antigen/teichoic acid export membrane protein
MPPMIGRALSASIAIATMRASVMACKFALAIFIGRYLDLSSLGIYGLAAGTVAVGPTVIGMGLVHLIARDAVTFSVSQLADSLRHYWCLMASVYAVLLTVAISLQIVFGTSGLWALVIVIALFEHLGNDVFQLLSNLERPLIANMSAFFRGAAWILIYVPVAAWNPSLRSISVLLGFWLGGSVIAFLLFMWASRSWPWKAAFLLPFRLGWIASTVREAFIIYISDLSFVASQYVDRYLITLFLGLKLAGIYFLFWSFANAASTFVSMVILQAQRPALIKAHHDRGTPFHRQLTSRFLKVITLASAVVSATTGCIFHLVVPFFDQPSVADHLAAFWLLLVAMAFRNIADFGAIALFTARRDQIMTVTNIAALIVLALAQSLLLPFTGLYGAGGAILLTFSGVALWRFMIVFRGPSLKKSWRRMHEFGSVRVPTKVTRRGERSREER